MKRLFKKYGALIGVVSVIALSGCSSQPREVTAETPLVQPSLTVPGKLISEKYWDALSQPSTVQLTHNSYQIETSPLYISALGNYCRNVKITSETMTTTRVACSAPRTHSEPNKRRPWYLVNNVINEKASIEL
ncbi:hypothetical protein ACQEXU_12310 [Vibrio sp. TRT 21S02]|uniref:hypothetical protein n=1 Tax=unclassified Vibrio TaxID=2614977 RepID=UPI00349FBFDD